MTKTWAQLVCLLLLLTQAAFVAGRGRVFCVPVTPVIVQHACTCDHLTEAEPSAHEHAGVAILSDTDDHRPCSECVHVRTPETSARPANTPVPDPTPGVEIPALHVLIAHAVLAASGQDSPSFRPLRAEPPWTLRAESRALKAVRLLV